MDELGKLRTQQLKLIKQVAQEMEKAAGVLGPLYAHEMGDELLARAQRLKDALLNLRDLRERLVGAVREIREELQRSRDQHEATRTYTTGLFKALRLGNVTALRRREG